jgi:hypothetical protein
VYADYIAWPLGNTKKKKKKKKTDPHPNPKAFVGCQGI